MNASRKSTMVQTGLRQSSETASLSSKNTVGIESFITAIYKLTLIQVVFYLFTYPDLDTGAGGGTQPVAVGAEAEGVDGVTTVQGVEVLALIQVPQHGLAVLNGK